MNRRAYYRNMQALALDVRKRNGLTRADISIKQMWKVYRAEGIERIDFWPNLRQNSGSIFQRRMRRLSDACQGTAGRADYL